MIWDSFKDKPTVSHHFLYFHFFSFFLMVLSQLRRALRIPLIFKFSRINKEQIYLYLWNTRTMIHIKRSKDPVHSHISNAQGICGTLSKKMSGSGGYFFISGTRSWTTTITKAVIQVTTKRYARLMSALVTSGLSLVALPSSERGGVYRDETPWWSYSENEYASFRIYKILVK